MSNKCTDCLSNCDPAITDKCVKNTVTNDTYGVEKGISLYELTNIILDSLLTYANGTGVMPDVTLCSFLNYSGSGDLSSILQSLSDGECSLNTRLTALAAQVNAPFSFNTACLTGDLSSRDKILQAVILQSCTTATQVATIDSSYVKQSDLCTQVAACLAGTATQYKDRMVPYTVIPYEGPLSNFDNTGKGLAANGYDKIYLCNGLNGTKDWRGRSPIGAIQNVPGATLDSTVDPSLPANVNYNYSIGDKKGKSSDTLTVNQIAAHTHTVTDPGHTHAYVTGTRNADGWSGDSAVDDLGPVAAITLPAVTGITINSAGGGQSHNTTHPVIAAAYITYIP